MNRLAVLLAALLLLGGVVPAPARHTGLLPMDKVFVGIDRFEGRCHQLRAVADKVRAMPIGERTAWFGQVFLGTPYKGFTLEIDDHVEAPSVNLAGLDCWTFFEIALAFARMVEEPAEQWTPETLLRYIEMDRYWGGEC